VYSLAVVTSRQDAGADQHGDDPALIDGAGAVGDVALSRCAACDAVSYPSVSRCATCQGPVQDVVIEARGSVFTYTVAHQPFCGDVSPPYVIALVELDQYPGVRIVANIVGCQPGSVHIGMAVQGQQDSAQPRTAAPQLVPAR
jgi:uncharacterized protein